MSVNCVIGLQWGDEGKGRIVDYLAQKADMVIRFQGGDNAGHTVVNEKGKFGLHILPSGIFNDDTMNIVGAGTVVNFDRMHSELEEIEKVTGEKIESVFIDEREAKARKSAPQREESDLVIKIKLQDAESERRTFSMKRLSGKNSRHFS